MPKSMIGSIPDLFAWFTECIEKSKDDAVWQEVLKGEYSTNFADYILRSISFVEFTRVSIYCQQYES